MLHLPEFVWTLCSSVFFVFNNFLLIDATDRSKISSDQKRFFIALNLYPLSFFANTPFKGLKSRFFSVIFINSTVWDVNSIAAQYVVQALLVIFTLSNSNLN